MPVLNLRRIRHRKVSTDCGGCPPARTGVSLVPFPVVFDASGGVVTSAMRRSKNGPNRPLLTWKSESGTSLTFHPAAAKPFLVVEVDAWS
jgi:hypothetical protein